MAEKMNIELNKKDESAQEIAECPTVQLEDTERYEAELGAREIVERCSNQTDNNDVKAGNVKDKPEREVVEGQEDQQKKEEQNNTIKLQTDMIRMMRLLHRRSSNVPIANKQPQFPETMQQRQNDIGFEGPGFKPGPRCWANNGHERPILRGSWASTTPPTERQSVCMQDLDEIDANPDHIFYTPDGSVESDVICNHLKMAAMNLTCAQQLTGGHRSDIPTWPSIIKSWKKQKTDPPVFVVTSTPDALVAARAQAIYKASQDPILSRRRPFAETPLAVQIAEADAAAAILRNPPMSDATDDTMVKWAEAVDSDVLATHPVIEAAIARGIVQRPIVYKKCVYSRTDKGVRVDSIDTTYEDKRAVTDDKDDATAANDNDNNDAIAANNDDATAANNDDVTAANNDDATAATATTTKTTTTKML